MKTTDTSKTSAAFESGFWWGAENGEATSRQADEFNSSFSVVETAAFCEGSVDGAVGDHWRRRTAAVFADADRRGADVEAVRQADGTVEWRVAA